MPRNSDVLFFIFVYNIVLQEEKNKNLGNSTAKSDGRIQEVEINFIFKSCKFQSIQF